MIEIKKYKEFDYLERVPDNFDDGKKYPLIIFCHGAGGRGRDLELLKTNPFFTITNDYNLPAVTFAPQCYSEGCWYDIFEQLQEFIEFARSQKYIDKSRVYMIGASMGGYCTWQMAMTHPEWFAAIAPVCGGGMYWLAYRLKNVPVWAFHGDSDKTVFTEESIKMVDAVNGAGGNAKLTICKDVGHNSWINAYNTKELFDWLLSKKLSDADNEKGNYGSVEKFG